MFILLYIILQEFKLILLHYIYYQISFASRVDTVSPITNNPTTTKVLGEKGSGLNNSLIKYTLVVVLVLG